MTYRERRLAKAERLRGWSEKNAERSAEQFSQSHAMMDVIPFGQPILIGHHSERRDRNYRDRAWNKMGKAVELSKKADNQASRADNIEAAAERAIYDDDPDAIERLEAKVAQLERERETMKAFNKTVRKGSPDFSLLTEAQAANFRSAAQHFPWIARKGFDTANTSGLLSKTRERLERLRKLKANDDARESREADGAMIAPCINRAWVEVSFPGKPDVETREELKVAGFRWDGKRVCWVGQLEKLPARYAE